MQFFSASFRERLLAAAALVFGLFVVGQNVGETTRWAERFETYYRPPERLFAGTFVPFKGSIPRLFSDDDSYMHLMLLREMHDTGALRQEHWTHADNAPEGRVVYWSSLYLSWVHIV